MIFMSTMSSDYFLMGRKRTEFLGKYASCGKVFSKFGTPFPNSIRNNEKI